jgi:hypothetical protein
MHAGKESLENSKPGQSRLEGRLADTLRPVAPRREFVRKVGSHIQNLRRPVRRAGLSTFQYFLLLMAGISSLAVLCVMAVRGVIKWLGRSQSG